MSITGRTYLERGRPVVVITQWRGKGPRNVAIRREDGRLRRSVRITAAGTESR